MEELVLDILDNNEDGEYEDKEEDKEDESNEDEENEEDEEDEIRVNDILFVSDIMNVVVPSPNNYYSEFFHSHLKCAWHERYRRHRRVPGMAVAPEEI